MPYLLCPVPTENVCACSRAKRPMWEGASLFNGRDRRPWGLRPPLTPLLEALEEGLGAVLLIQVGLIMPVHPLPLTLPPLHQIWEETHDKGRQGRGGGVCVCGCVRTTCGHLDTGARSQGTSILLQHYYLALAPCCNVAPLSSFVEAALGLINTQTICQTLSTGSATALVPNRGLFHFNSIQCGENIIQWIKMFPQNQTQNMQVNFKLCLLKM